MECQLYLDVPNGFATKVAVLNRPSVQYLPEGPWLLLGDASVRHFWRSLGMPEPPVCTWVETCEATKRMETMMAWLDLWAVSGIHRGHTLVVVGGGTMTDMGGLAAGLYMRGIAWHAWPTSLLAQIDAAIGGKTAVNLESGKNLVGMFYHPKRVVIADRFLESLPRRHLESGKWELIKMALVDGDTDWAESMLGQGSPSPDYLKRAIRLKIDIINRDFKENGERRLLNLGHTLGHAYESASDYGLLHGEAVGLGLIASCMMSELKGYTSFQVGFIEKMAQRLAYLLDRVPAWEKCLPYLLRDKKTVEGGQIRYVFPISGSRPACHKISPDSLEPVHAKLIRMMNPL